jgi:superoxide dismutase
MAQTQPSSDNLSKQQLLSLISSAKTPAEHIRIAQYYGAKAQDYLAQSKEHAQMAEQFKSNSLTSSAKFSAGTVNHCEFLAQNLKQKAEQMQKLAAEHEQMAREAGQK